jgi:hypothetical protein
MLKYSTGRGKPGWGKESCKPIWWPEDIPWANVRSDVRTEEQKQRVRLKTHFPCELTPWYHYNVQYGREVGGLTPWYHYNVQYGREVGGLTPWYHYNVECGREVGGLTLWYHYNVQYGREVG